MNNTHYIIIKNQFAVATPFRKIKGGSSRSNLNFLSLFYFFIYKLCFLIIFFIYRVVDMTPIIKS